MVCYAQNNADINFFVYIFKYAYFYKDYLRLKSSRASKKHSLFLCYQVITIGIYTLRQGYKEISGMISDKRKYTRWTKIKVWLRSIYAIQFFFLI